MYDFDVATSIINLMRKMAIDKYKDCALADKEAISREILQYNREYNMLCCNGSDEKVERLYDKVFSEYSPIVKAYVRD